LLSPFWPRQNFFLPSSIRADIRISGPTADAGVLHIYGCSWYSFDDITPGEIKNGVLSVDPKKIVFEDERLEKYVVLLSMSSGDWYVAAPRTALPSVSAIEDDVRGMGSVDGGGAVSLQPNPVQEIDFETVDGKSYPFPDGESTSLWIRIFISDQNHIGYPNGPALPVLHAQGDRKVRFRAPLIALAVQSVGDALPGAGCRFKKAMEPIEVCDWIALKPGLTHVVKIEKLEKTAHTIHVLDQKGLPLEGVKIQFGGDRCQPYWFQIADGLTDKDGSTVISFDPRLVFVCTMVDSKGRSAKVGEDFMANLLSKGEALYRWEDARQRGGRQSLKRCPFDLPAASKTVFHCNGSTKGSSLFRSFGFTATKDTPARKSPASRWTSTQATLPRQRTLMSMRGGCISILRMSPSLIVWPCKVSKVPHRPRPPEDRFPM
jgi:hypothetical protein